MHKKAIKLYGHCDDSAKTVEVSIKEMHSKADVAMGVYYQLSTHDSGTNELFYSQLGKTSGSVALALMRDFNFPDTDWKYHTDTIKSGNF